MHLLNGWILLCCIKYWIVFKILDNLLYISVFGELRSMRMPKKLSGTGSHRGFAFAQYESKKDAKVRAFN